MKDRSPQQHRKANAMSTEQPNDEKRHPSLISNKAHPEWGTFSVRLERGGEWYEIRGDGGTTVLHFGEVHHWNVLEWAK